MDKNIGLKEYNYLSRYANTAVYADSKGRTYHGTGKWLEDNSASVYICQQGDTLEKIAQRQYGSPVLWWVVADVNRMVDPTAELKEGQELKLITIGDLQWFRRG